jgi:two-component system sensor histidine kinase CpxA
MFRLVLKIFLAYWVAAGVVLFVSDFEPHRQIHHSEISDALNGSLAMNGRMLAAAYESGSCPEMRKLIVTKNDAMTIATPDGTFLCGDPGISQEEALILTTVRSGKRMTTNHALFQVIAQPVVSPDTGKHYVLLFKNSYSSALQFYGLMPGYTTIAISCVVTLFLAFLVALPIRVLRTAARQIALGNLDARVGWNPIAEKIYGFNGRDDIAKLVFDFNHMAERLQALADSQKLLLRDVSHELRSPLARLRVGLGLARREAPPSMEEHLDRIESETLRLNDLIGQILSLSYLETLHEIELPDNVSVSDLLADLLPDLQYEASQHECAVTCSIGPDCYVKGDAELIRAAVENVVRNAIRYVPNAGLVHVEAALVERDGKQMSVIRIDDNGPGIPDAELKSVLDPFYRADKSRHWQKTGFGIGLAIANRAAQVHGGTIDLRNRPDCGLTVEMAFPLSAEPA